MNNKRINYLFTILFIISIIYTTLRLFSLQDDLILSSQVLDSSQIASLSPVLLQLYIAVGLTILTGVVVLAISFNAGSSNLNTAHLTSSGNNGNLKSNNESDNTKIETETDVSFVENALKNASNKNEKLSTILNTLCQKLELGQGAIYTPSESKGIRFVEFQAGYAFSIPESGTIKFEFGEGLVGQVAKEGQTLIVDDIPDNYINIISGLGSASPKFLMILPVFNDKTLQAVVELASFTKFSEENTILIRESFNLINKTNSKAVEEKDKASKESAEKKPKASSTKSKKKAEE